MLRYLAVIISLFYILPRAYALNSKPSIVCGHHQLCNLLQEVLAVEEHPYISPIYPDIASDPHELKIDPELLKKYFQASFLILVDPILAPWQSSVLKERKSTNTFVAGISAHDLTGRFSDAKAHFWLYSDELCHLRQSLASKVSQWNYRISPHATDCSPARTLIIKKKIKNGLKNHFYILTHDALAPLLESLNAQFLVLKGSGHTHEIAPEVFKELHQKLKSYESVSWIVETEIGLPVQIRELIRKSDRQLNIKVTGRPGESTLSVLENLARILNHE